MKSRHFSKAFPLAAAMLLLTLACDGFHCSAADITPDRLSCEYSQAPLGIDVLQPRLNWIVTSQERAQLQKAYQILVSSSEASLKKDQGELWDTGKVPSGETLHIVYSGKPLTSRHRCFWKVRVWDKTGKASDWSSSGWWEMGLLQNSAGQGSSTLSGWTAKWIARTTDTNSNPAPLFRRVFNLSGQVKKARAYISGLGYYELHINGKKIGDHLLDPGYTRYDKRVLYATYDVTDALRSGRNAIGIILGNGWYNVHTVAVWDFQKAPWRASPRVLMQLDVEYSDGRTETIVTDGDWKTSTGPITFDSIYGGQTYDARQEKPEWATPAYDDSAWLRALEVEPPKGKLSAQMMPPIRVDTTIKPVKLTEPKPGTFIVDFGQNFAGFAELNLPAAAPEKATKEKPLTITLRYGERLTKGGMLDRAEIQQHVLKLDPHQQFQTDTYVLNGQTPTNVPRFCYHGFQYVEVTGFPGTPTPGNFRGVFIHSAVEPRGEFECSNPLFNKIWRASRWSYLSNLQGIPTDCPHREKNGWTGDAHLAAEQGLFNFQPEGVYTKWINDLADEQQPGGELPGIVPTSGWGYKWGNGPAWDSAFLQIPFYMYQYSGDARILTEHYRGLKRYVDYLTSKAKDGIVSIGLPDWAPFETKTPADITSTAYYYRDAQIVALSAQLLAEDQSASGALDYSAEARKYSALAQTINAGFNRKFYNPTTGLYGNGSQTSLSCALYHGLVEPQNQPRVLSNLVAAVEKRNWHIDTGILGAKYLLNALLENGRADVAFRVASQKDLPSWGWWFEQGATTLWEQWNGTESRNHIMFGDISAWFYKAIAGINPGENFVANSAGGPPENPSTHSTAFKHFIIKPNVVGDLTWAKATYDSARGPISSEWKRTSRELTLNVTLPANTTATVWLPCHEAQAISEGGKPIATVEGIHSAVRNPQSAIENGWVRLEVGSGTYHFKCTLP